MITVWVDRDSVAMGDDVESHEVAWEFEDHACPGDVLERIVETHYLASVAGDVSWSLRVGTFEVEPRKDYTSVRGLQTSPAAVLNVPLVGQPSVIVLSTYSLMQPFVRRPELAVSDRVWAVSMSYASGGGLLPMKAFSGWLHDDEKRRRSIVAS